MSVRKYTAAAAGLFAASVVAGVGLTGAGAAGNGGLPFITGGGKTQNLNSGVSANPLANYGGFTARATGQPTTDGDGDVVYPARGEVQGKTKDESTKQTLGKLHGDVVCIANLGPSSGNDGGGDPNGNIWEIRFQIERGTFGPQQLTGLYGSLFVQDNGPRNDFSDESFAMNTNPECGDITEFQMEPHQGQITVHNG